MTVQVFQPQISVVLKKNIGRSSAAGGVAASQRFTGTTRQIDLTPYLGDSGSVTVSKSVRQPAGMFTITLADNLAPGELESLYGIIEPMDVIEIRMARDTSIYAGAFIQNMPIMMRGFVTDMVRSETFDGDRPARRVIISGQDYGKILQINQIAYLPNEVTGQNLLTYFKFFVNYGLQAHPDQDASQFVTEVNDKVILQFLAAMRQAATANGVSQGYSPILDIKVDAKVKSGLISPFGTNEWPGGTIYDLLTYYGDVGPWNELFIEDREDAPYLVYRPNPFKDTSGNYIQPPYQTDPSQAPALNAITDESLVSIESARSDAGVYNYFWTDNQSYTLIQSSILQAGAAFANPANIFLSDYPNSSPFLYGFRRMQTQSQQGGRFDGQTETVFDNGRAVALPFIAAKREVILESNKDNVVFESGRMKLRGNEAIKAGTYLRLTRGVGAVGASAAAGMKSEVYAHTVQHEFVPFRSYTTAVYFDRGTGFIERIQRGNGADSPYFSEMRTGGLYV